MKLLKRYITRQLIGASLFTLAALLGLYLFFDIMSEISKLGQGSYNTPTMFLYLALLLPGHAYELMPLAVLIGGMVAMTQLASHSEYTVMRTSGVSNKQIATLLIKFGFGFAILTAILGEVLVPLSEQKAERVHLRAVESNVSASFNSGIWIKDNLNIINVGEMLPDNSLKQLRMYEHSADNQLKMVANADSGTYNQDGTWDLNNVKVSRLEGNRVVVENHASLHINSAINPKLLNVLLVKPEQMSVANLDEYIDHLEANKQKTQRYRIAFWSKFFYPLACISMALVALAFTPQQRRGGSLGTRLFLGICLGVGFNFTNRFFSFLGQLYDWNAILSATLPTLVFLLAGIWMIRRQERR